MSLDTKPLPPSVTVKLVDGSITLNPADVALAMTRSLFLDAYILAHQADSSSSAELDLREKNVSFREWACLGEHLFDGVPPRMSSALDADRMFYLCNYLGIDVDISHTLDSRDSVRFWKSNLTPRDRAIAESEKALVESLSMEGADLAAIDHSISFERVENAYILGSYDSTDILSLSHYDRLPKTKVVECASTAVPLQCKINDYYGVSDPTRKPKNSSTPMGPLHINSVSTVLQVDLRVIEDWTDICLAGGACLSTLTQRPGRGQDLDFFITTMDPVRAVAAVERIFNSFGRRLLLPKFGVWRSQYAISFFVRTSDSYHDIRKVQIVLRLFNSVAQVLTNFDVDCCCFAIQGDRQYALPRAIRALYEQYVVASPEQSSRIYARRLYKYIRRGMSVVVPGWNPALSTTDISRQGGASGILQSICRSHCLPTKFKHAEDYGTYIDQIGDFGQPNDYLDMLARNQSREHAHNSDPAPDLMSPIVFFKSHTGAIETLRTKMSPSRDMLHSVYENFGRPVNNCIEWGKPFAAADEGWHMVDNDWYVDMYQLA